MQISFTFSLNSMTSEWCVGWQDTNIHSVSSLSYMLPLSVIISFIVSLVVVLLGISLDVGKVPEVAEDVVVSVVTVSRRLIVAENGNSEIKENPNFSSTCRVSNSHPCHRMFLLSVCQSSPIQECCSLVQS